MTTTAVVRSGGVGNSVTAQHYLWRWVRTWWASRPVARLGWPVDRGGRRGRCLTGRTGRGAPSLARARRPTDARRRPSPLRARALHTPSDITDTRIIFTRRGKYPHIDRARLNLMQLLHWPSPRWCSFDDLCWDGRRLPTDCSVAAFTNFREKLLPNTYGTKNITRLSYFLIQLKIVVASNKLFACTYCPPIIYISTFENLSSNNFQTVKMCRYDQICKYPTQ